MCINKDQLKAGYLFVLHAFFFWFEDSYLHAWSRNRLHNNYVKYITGIHRQINSYSYICIYTAAGYAIVCINLRLHRFL